MLIKATLCYVDDGQSFLLLLRNKKVNDIHKNKWIGVGGKCLINEAIDACVKREVYEETGLHIENPQLKGKILFPLFDTKNDWLVYVYVAKQFTGSLTTNCLEGELHWINYDDVLSKPTWEGDRIFLKWLLTDAPFFNVKMCYENDRLRSWQWLTTTID